MKKIQEKLREILGNTARIPKHLACGNLPSRGDVTSVWQEAGGIIYSAKLLWSPFLEVAAMLQNPHSFGLEDVEVGVGHYTISLTGVPGNLGVTTDKLDVSIDLIDNSGSAIVPIMINSATYNSTTHKIIVDVKLYDAADSGAVTSFASGDIILLKVTLN